MTVKIVLGISQPKSKACLQWWLYMEKPIYGKWSDICLLGWKGLPRPPGMLLKYTKCLLLHLLAYCVLSLVYDTSLPQTSCWMCLFIYFFHLLKHVHLHFKHVREMASVSAAVTVFHRQAGGVCLWDTHKIDLATDTTTQSVLQGTAAPEGVPKSQKLSVSIIESDKL